MQTDELETDEPISEEYQKIVLDAINKEFIFSRGRRSAIRRSDVMNLLKENMLHTGIDVTKEVLDVWYEVTFLRFLLTDILNKSPDLAQHITDDTFDECRKRAQVFLIDRFKLPHEDK